MTDTAQTPAAHRRINIVSTLVFATLGVGFAVMLGRVAQLQVAPGEKLKKAMDQRVTTVAEPGPRGDIVDRRGRSLALTRFGKRIYVDPYNFPSPPGEAFQKLAGAMGLPVDKVVDRLVPALDKNDRLKNDPSVERNAKGIPHGSVRYVTIGSVVDDSIAQAVRAAKIPGVGLEIRSVRESPGDEAAASLLGLVGIDHKGLLGAEFFLDKALQPASGSISYVRDAASRPMWIAPGGYVAPKRGNDIRLSIDTELQAMAYEELKRGIEDADAAGGRLVMMDPYTGEILAMVDIIRHVPGLTPFPWRDAKDKTSTLPTGKRFKTIIDDDHRDLHPAAGRNRCIEDVYEPGSTFKPFMWATVTELGLASPDEVFNTENGKWNPYGKRHLEDVIKRATMTWSEVLVNSSNIGMAKGTSRLSAQQMHDAVIRFGFGSPTRIGMPGESPGIVTKLKDWSKYSQTSVAMGHEVAVTPIQMVQAFCCFARKGELAGTMPSARMLALDASAEGIDTGKRVLPEHIAELTRKTMRGVTQRVDDKMSKKDPKAAAPRYEWFGKSGTASIPLGKAPTGKRRPIGSDGYFPNQYNSSFIAGAPLDDPKLVVVAVIDDPGPAAIARKEHYGSYVAGPVVRRVMERALPYLGVPAAPPPAAASESVAHADH